MDLIEEFREECLNHGEQPARVTSRLYADLLDREVIDFVETEGRSGQIIGHSVPYFMGHELRVTDGMSVEYEFIGA